MSRGWNKMDPAWIVAAVALATLIAGFFGWILRKIFRALRLLVRFTDDYFGEPAGSGRPARPGVKTRLEKLEKHATEISAQVHLNSGTSLRDSVQRTELGMEDLKRSLAILSQKVEKLTGGKPLCSGRS